MRIGVDSNVLVSALLSPSGAPARVLKLWEAEAFELVVSEEILAEYARVMAYPRIAARLKLTEKSTEKSAESPKEKTIEELMGEFRHFAAIVEPGESPRVIADDPDDDKLLACALAGGAEYVVSGDEHLLSLGEYQGIQILPPVAFLTLLRDTFEGQATTND